MDIKVVYNGEMGFAQTLLNVYDYLIPAKGITFKEFIRYTKDSSKKTNAELVYDKMINMEFNSLYPDKSDLEKICDIEDGSFTIKPFEKIKYLIESGELYCPSPCVFYIDSSNVSEGIILQSSNLTVVNDNSNYNQDNDQIIFDLLRKNSKRKNKNKSEVDGYVRQRVKPLVWVWCKSLCPSGKFMPNSIFNLSPFISSISTTENETGGNFNINLLSIDGELNDRGDLKAIWSPSKNSMVNVDDNFLFRKVRNKLKQGDQYPEGSEDNLRQDPYERDYNSDKRNQESIEDFEAETLVLDRGLQRIKIHNLFENLLSPNDVVFISYYDSNIPIEYTEGFFTDNKNLPHLQWDMIGLINSISSQSETEGTSGEESVTGMDLMKLLIDDGSYFFMNSTGTDSPSSLFENIQLEQQGDQGNVGMIDESNRKSSNRTPLGKISSLYNPTQRNIGFIMNLLLSKLCNVEICPTQLFEFYEDKTIYNIPILENE